MVRIETITMTHNHTKKVTITCKTSQITMTPTFNDMIAHGGYPIAYKTFSNKSNIVQNLSIVMIAKMKIMMINHY